MVRQLRTFIMSRGFYEEAIAAPSMKAAIDAWGGDKNLFHKGFASETDDPVIIAAAMKHPGTVLKRPVGSTGSFKQHAELPTSLPAGRTKIKPAKSSKSRKAPGKSKLLSDADTRKATVAYEREEKRRKKMRQKKEAAEEKAAEQRAAAIARANDALTKALNQHDRQLFELEAESAMINAKIEKECSTWSSKRLKLEAALAKAR